MAKLLVVASLILVANLVATPFVMGSGTLKKEANRSNQPHVCIQDPPFEDD